MGIQIETVLSPEEARTAQGNTAEHYIWASFRKEKEALSILSEKRPRVGYLLSGKLGWLSSEGASSAHIRGGEWFVLGKAHPPASVMDQPEGMVLSFDLNWLCQLYAFSPESQSHPFFHCAFSDPALFRKGRDAGRLDRLVSDMNWVLGSRMDCPLMTLARTQEILATILGIWQLEAEHAPNSKILSSHDLGRLDAVAEHLRQHYEEAHSLKALSRQFGINEFKLKKGFRQRYRESVFGFLRQIRMAKAMECLCKGASVMEVAGKVGYSNPSHFARAFREAHGINPSEWRKYAATLAESSPASDLFRNVDK